MTKSTIFEKVWLSLTRLYWWKKGKNGCLFLDKIWTFRPVCTAKAKREPCDCYVVVPPSVHSVNTVCPCSNKDTRSTGGYISNTKTSENNKEFHLFFCLFFLKGKSFLASFYNSTSSVQSWFSDTFGLCKNYH